jgi:hypothetical protein
VPPALTMVRHDLRDLSAIGRLVTLIKRRKIECVVSNAGIHSDRGVALRCGGAISWRRTSSRPSCS